MYGLVITARCDIDQQKYPVLNYIPVVRLGDWLATDGFDLLKDKAQKDAYGKIKNLFKTSGFAESLLISKSAREIFETSKNIIKQKDHARFEECISQYELATTEFPEMDDRLSDFFSTFQPLKSSLINDLIKHKVSGYYFLPKVYPGDTPHGYVGLLREATFIPREIAAQVAYGAEKTTIENGNLLSAGCLSFDCDDFAMPISQVPSPDIEHILQSFSMMFGRIGLPDPDPVLIGELCQSLPEKAKVAV
ncbi:hypothetical protein HFO87_09275 [Rhizobium leguminosarum]|uniref:hypothetical protein n=1 Tax=Rhizobium leguminosarum TaxID=384 RepID=UPI001C954EF3|nr:hypothetical protein [Rhizobium leguminosarum]MBY5484662.1 hypothetical protein [Rhizobium leguminosarum]